MGKTSNYTKTVMESLSKLADKVDVSGSGTGGKADFYDVVSNSLARISDNYNGSGGGGGTGGGVLIVNDVSGTLDKTWTEINSADLAFVSINEGGMKATGFVALTAPSEAGYVVGAISYGESETGIVMLSFAAESADGYPVHK